MRRRSESIPAPEGDESPTSRKPRIRRWQATVAITTAVVAIGVVLGLDHDPPRMSVEASSPADLTTTSAGLPEARGDGSSTATIETQGQIGTAVPSGECPGCPSANQKAPTTTTNTGTGSGGNRTGTPTTTTTVPTVTAPPVTPPPPVSTDGVTLSQGAVRPGGSLKVQATGFRARTSVRVELHSDPILLTVTSAAADGTVTVDVTIPATAPEGTHHIVATGDDPNGGTLTRTIAVVLDVSAPEITAVSASPGTVSAGGTVTFSMRLTDASGVGYATFQPMRAGAGDFAPFCSGMAQLTSGTAQDGTWTRTCTVPDVVIDGTYKVWPFARDNLGNWLNTNGGPTTDLRGTFTVVGGVSDTSAPAIVSMAASPSMVSPGATVTFSMHLIDPAGVVYATFQPMRDGAPDFAPFCSGLAELTSGTAQDGTWTRSCTVPDTVISGTYKVWPFAKDGLGNWLNTNGGPSTDLRGTFTVTGGVSDISAPGITSITASPTSVSAGGTLTFSMRLTDPSGVVYATFQPMRDGAADFAPFCSGTAQLTSGTAQDGTWTMTCTVPDVVIGGTYKVWPFARDNLGNWLNTNGGPTTDLRGTFTIS